MTTSQYPNLTATSYDIAEEQSVEISTGLEPSFTAALSLAAKRMPSSAPDSAKLSQGTDLTGSEDFTTSVDENTEQDASNNGNSTGNGGRKKSLFDDTTTTNETENGHSNNNRASYSGGGRRDEDDDDRDGIEEEEIEVSHRDGYVPRHDDDLSTSELEASERKFSDEENPEDMEAGGGAADHADKKLLEDEDALYERLVGDVMCWCRPRRAKGCRDFGRRTGDWLFLNKEQILSGITVGINQVPAVTTSAIIAGVDPKLALQSTWIMNVLTALIGGGPGMVSGSTTFIGLSLSDLVERDGVEYVFWAVMFAGILQIAFGLLGLGRIMRLVPRPLQMGFQNGMGLLLFAAQFRYARVDMADAAGGTGLHHMTDDRRSLVEVGHSWNQHTNRGAEWIGTFAFAAWGITAFVCFLTCLILPRLTRVVPSTFVAIFVGCLLEWAIFRRFSNWHSPTIGDYADISTSTLMPVWLEYDMPLFNLDTFKKVYLHGFSVFGVGLMESLLTLNLVDDLNEVSNLRNRVSFGQGLANVVSSILGGMGGAGMVGQSMVANKADGITGLSTFLAGLTMVVIIFGAYPIVNFIPLSAFAGIMFYAAHNLVEYRSILTGLAALLPESMRDALHLDYKIPRMEVLIMLTVTVVILVFDLAIAVCAGVLIAVFVYVWDSSARVVVEREPSDNGESVTYNISGPLFFATAQNFIEIFSLEEIELDPEDVIIMLEGAEVHDSSGMFALKRLHDRFVAMGKTVALSSLSPTSRRLMEKYASTWEGVSFLEIEEIEEEEEENIEVGANSHGASSGIVNEEEQDNMA